MINLKSNGIILETYIIDHTNGGWYEEGLDNEPQRKTALKGAYLERRLSQFQSAIQLREAVAW